MIRTTLAGALAGLLVLASPTLAQDKAPQKKTPEKAPDKGADKGAEKAPDEFPAAWHFYGNNAAQWAKIEPKVKALVGKPAPAMVLGDFHGAGGKPVDQLKGEIIVIDFWATWCGPCKAAVPSVNKIREAYAESGVKVIGVCCTRGADTIAMVADEHHMAYPTAADLEGKTAEAYGVQWWPYFMIIDSQGKVRAAGLSTSHLEDAVRRMLTLEGRALPPTIAEREKGGAPEAPKATNDASKGDRAEVFATPVAWLEGSGARRSALDEMHGRPAPAIAGTEWRNTEPMGPVELRGKIVVVDFWATWCGPCIASIPHNNERYAEFKDRGVVLLGACAAKGAERLDQTIEQRGIAYPVFVDADGAMNKAYSVDGFPDYFVIGRDGRVVGADVRNANVWELVERMLEAEKKG